MPSKALVVLIALAMISTSSVAMARGGGGGMSHGGHSGPGAPFNPRFLHPPFRNNQAFFGGGGWGYGGSGYENTTVLAFPQAAPQVADVTGSTRAAPCHWNEDTFTVPANQGRQLPVKPGAEVSASLKPISRSSA